MKINPTRKQKLQIDRLAGCVRVVYNASIARINEMRSRTVAWPQGSLAQHLRNKFATNIHNDAETYGALHGPGIDRSHIIVSKTNKTKLRYVNPFFFERSWLSNCPKDYRGRAAFKAADAYEIALGQWRRGTIKSFAMTPITKKKVRKKGVCFGIERNVKFCDGDPHDKRSGELTILGIDGPIRFFEKPPIDKTPEMGCELSKDICGDYWLHIPVFRRKKPLVGDTFAAIDPGGVVPWAFYSPAGESGSLGVSMNRRLMKRSKEISAVDLELSGDADKATKDRLYALRRKLFRAKKRIRDHEHYRAINFLTGRYDGVLLPKLKTKRLSGGLKPKANHDLQDISHFTFLRRMTERCLETNTVLEHPSEYYTSKICGRCSQRNIPGTTRNGTYRPYRCLRCGLIAHRDVHAARNIYMKWLIELLFS
jgi:transposase